MGSVYSSLRGRTFRRAWCRIASPDREAPEALERFDREASIVPPHTTAATGGPSDRAPCDRPRARWIGVVLACALASGCMMVYQPVRGLQRPVVVDPTHPNLRDTRIDLVCRPEGGVRLADANVLCQRVGQLFENQGALVNTGVDEDDRGEAPVEPRAVHLRMQIASRKVNESYHPLTWFLYAASFTVVPAVTEQTFAQDITVRDAAGSLLARETLEGRLVHRYGVGNWVATVLTDLFRPREQRIGGDAAEEDLSNDVYRQLSQIAFDARVHAQVLRVAAPAPGPAPAPRSAPPAALPGLEPVPAAPATPTVGEAP